LVLLPNGRQSIVKRNGGFFFARYTLCSKVFPDHYPEIAVGVQSKLSVWLMPFPINLFPQLPRTPKGHNPPRFQHHVFTGCWVPSPASMLRLDTKFAETTDKDIVTGFKGSLYDFQQIFDHFGRLVLCIADLLCDRFNDVGFGKGHR
jgi:hypothetical protein